jgi:hypothetical protein
MSWSSLCFGPPDPVVLDPACQGFAKSSSIYAFGQLLVVRKLYVLSLLSSTTMIMDVIPGNTSNQPTGGQSTSISPSSSIHRLDTASSFLVFAASTCPGSCRPGHLDFCSPHPWFSSIMPRCCSSLAMHHCAVAASAVGK